MGRSALRAALAAEKGVDYKKLKEKKKHRQAVKEKAKKTKKTGDEDDEEEEEDDDEDDKNETNGLIDDEAEESEDGEGEGAEPSADFIAAMDDSDESDSEVEMEAKIERKAQKGEDKEDEEEEEEEDEEEEEEEEDEEEVDWSDLDEEERVGLSVKRRQTINNKAALTAALARIRVPTDASVPFSTHQSVTPFGADEPTAAAIEDIQDDVARELQLYRQSRDAAVQARRRLRAEGVPFSRPTDYFAEMVKDDEHMQQVRARLVADATAKKASAEARRQRELKKFGKQVQVAKMQERAKAKKDTLEKIQTLKRKRQENGASNTHEADLFDVAIDREISKPTAGRGRDRASSRAGGAPNAKRQKKNEKYGFGGKKRNAKSGDARSSGDLSGFNARRMKTGGGSGGGFKAQRPGKARRKATAGRR